MWAGRNWICSCDENREDQRGDIWMLQRKTCGRQARGKLKCLTEVCGETAMVTLTGTPTELSVGRDKKLACFAKLISFTFLHVQMCGS